MEAKDPYQRGDTTEWLKHSNEELALLVKKRSRQLQRARTYAALLVGVIAWILFNYSQHRPLRELWPF